MLRRRGCGPLPIRPGDWPLFAMDKGLTAPSIQSTLPRHQAIAPARQTMRPSHGLTKAKHSPRVVSIRLMSMKAATVNESACPIRHVARPHHVTTLGQVHATLGRANSRYPGSACHRSKHMHKNKYPNSRPPTNVQQIKQGRRRGSSKEGTTRQASRGTAILRETRPAPTSKPGGTPGSRHELGTGDANEAKKTSQSHASKENATIARPAPQKLKNMT